MNDEVYITAHKSSQNAGGCRWHVLRAHQIAIRAIKESDAVACVSFGLVCQTAKFGFPRLRYTEDRLCRLRKLRNCYPTDKLTWNRDRWVELAKKILFILKIVWIWLIVNTQYKSFNSLIILVLVSQLIVSVSVSPSDMIGKVTVHEHSGRIMH